MILILFFLWRIFDLAAAGLATRVIPYLGFFPYKEIFADYRLPHLVTGWANFDGAQYLLIVREGYNQFTQAYFPLYPLLVKAVSLVVSNQLLSGLFISNASFVVGLYFFRQYLVGTGEETSPLQAIAFLLIFPTSFFFGALYTEGLFFLLLVLVLYGLQRKKYRLVAIAGFLAALTRLIGVFLIIPIGLRMIQNQMAKTQGKNYGSRLKNINPVSCFIKSLTTNFYLLTPLLGLLAYMFYLWKTTADPLFFFHSQPVFGANRSTHLILLPQVYFRYLKIFLTAAWNFQYFVSAIEFLVFNFFLFILMIYGVKSWQRFKGKNFRLWLLTENVGLMLFSLVNLLLPTLTGTFSSVPRYALMSLTVFIYLGQIKTESVKIMVAIAFIVLHLVTLGYFIQGYFIG
ncbi:hypothetical protein M1523_04555 [Patescibacteria group bacterium]|nr:hypothetical protein [Patescibacteria group bacterium]MCL5091506.1 hypothetical protein [Patescibacteria group bacterium]